MSTKAGEEYLAAFRRLVARGTRVSQNAVAKEAGRDPSAFKLSSYPEEIAIVKAYIKANYQATSSSITHRLKASREETKKAKNSNDSIVQQRDTALIMLSQAHVTILDLKNENTKLKKLMNHNVYEAHFGDQKSPENF